MGYLRGVILSAVIIMPLLVWANGDVVKEGQPQKKEPVTKTDMKKAPGPEVKKIPEEYKDLEATMKEYWEARKKGDYEAAYKLESETVRKQLSLDFYKERFKSAAGVIAVRPLEVKPTNEKEVMVRASFAYKAGPVDTVRFIDDHWIKEDAGWRHLPEKN